MKGKLFWLVLLWVNLMVTYSSSAQESILNQFKTSELNTDSAAQVSIAKLRFIKNDSSKVMLLNELGKYYISYSHSDSINLKKAIPYLQEGVRISDSIYNEHAPDRFMSKMLLARAYIAITQVTKGAKLFQSVIDYYHLKGYKNGEANALLMLATCTSYKKDTTVLENYNRSIELYHESGNSLMEIEARLERAYFAFRFNLDSTSEKELSTLAEISQNYGCFRLAVIYNRLAKINRYFGNLNSALAYSLASIKTAEEMGDLHKMDEYLGEIAIEYGELGKQQESIEYFKKCIVLREQSNTRQYVIYRTATLMIEQMIKINQGKEGYEFLNALKKRNPPHSELEKAIIEHGLANCLAASGRDDLAEKYFRTMVKNYGHSGEKEVRYIAYLDLVQFFIRIGKFKEAEAYYDSIRDAQSSLFHSRDAALYMFKIDSARQRYPQAIKNLLLYNKYNDSLFNKNKSDQIESLHIRYGSEQKDQNITLLTKQTELQQANLKQSELIRNSILGGSILIGALLVLVYNRYRLKIKSNLLLEKKQNEISNKNRSLELLVNEKEWLIREIHHRVKNNFHMVIGLMGKQSSYIKSDEALQALEESQNRIHAMSLIHQKLYQSENLSTIVMADYIHELVSFLKDSFETTDILFVINCDHLEFNATYSLPIGLILNEAITNSIKYAFPDGRQGTIEISLHQTSTDQMQLIVADNGIGITIQEGAPLPTSMGLSLIAGLSDDIGGILSIKNENGTVVQIDFDYEPEHKETPCHHTN